MLAHSDPRTTFVIDGLVCPKCGVVQRQLVPEQKHAGVIIKRWHPAWWEGKMTPEEFDKWQKQFLEEAEK